MTSSPPDLREPHTDRRRWLALGVCLAAGFMTMLDVSIVNVALPSIREVLHADATSMQLIVAGYTLAFGLALIPAGRLGDLFGRRRMFLIGLVAFLATSLAAGMAPSAEFLAIARLAQGVSAGIMNPQVVGLIQQLFSGHERAKAFGAFGATIGVSTALGPLIGGLLLQSIGPEHGWRWVFLINVPVIAATIVMAWRLLPKHVASGKKLRLDPVGLVLIAIAVMTALLPVVQSEGDGGTPASPWRWLWLIGTVIALALLLPWERRYSRRVGDPVLDATLLRTPSYRNGALLGFAYFAGFTSIFLVSMLFIQSGLGYNPLQAGLMAMPNAIASAFSSANSGRLVNRYGRKVVVYALVIVVVGLSAALAVGMFAPSSSVIWLLPIALAVAGLGGGCVVSPNQALTLADVPVAKAGTAAGLLQTGQRIGSAIGIAAVLAVFTSSLATHGTSTEAYGKAFSAGLILSVAFVVLALVVAIVDTRQRRQSGEPEVRRAIPDPVK